MGAHRAWGLCVVALLVASLGTGRASAADPLTDVPMTPLPADTIGPAPADNSLGLSAAPPIDDDDEACEENCFSVGCGPAGRVWFRADYLHWWTVGQNLPPLVTTGNVDTDLDEDPDPVGSLGQPSTRVLYGDSNVNTYPRSGYRLMTGLWLDPCQTWGVEGDYIDLQSGGSRFSTNSDAAGSPVLARPFYDVENGRQWRELASYPGFARGSITINTDDYFQLAGIGGRFNLYCSPCCDPCDVNGGATRVDAVAGYRYCRLEDTIEIREDITLLEEPTVGYGVEVYDGFRARNDFHGGELGFVVGRHRGPWSVELLTKLAFGNTRQEVTITGSTVTTNTSGNSINHNGGVFATTNRGVYVHNDFSVIPQLGLDVGYQVTCHLRMFFGGDFVYWSCVQRAGSAIDLDIDPRNVPGPDGATQTATNLPQFDFCGTSFWAMGMHGGLEFRY